MKIRKIDKNKRTMDFRNPHAYVIIFLLIIFSMVLTWILPSGSFDRVIDGVSGREIAIPGTFKLIDNKRVGFLQAIRAIPQGVVNSAPIITFSFIVPGAINIIRATGAIDSGIVKLVEIFKDRSVVFLIIITITFAVLGAVGFPLVGVLPFIPLGASIAMALGYDRVVGFHIVRTSAWVGYAAAFLNPLNVGVAQEIVGLPLFSGSIYRMFSFLVFLAIGLIFFLNYSKKVKNKPENSILYGYEGKIDEKFFKLDRTFAKFNKRHVGVLILFFASLIFLVYASFKYKWGAVDLSAFFLLLGIVSGLIGGLSPNEIGESLSNGMNQIAFGAMIIGFARAASIILEDGQVLDTIVNYMAQPLIKLPNYLTLVGMFIMQTFINFFIGTGSGQAAVTMPIMGPLSDLVGVTRQSAVLAFQFGDGITNMIFPQMIYILAFADIPYDRWVRHIFKLVIYLSIAAAILVSISGIFNYGPF